MATSGERDPLSKAVGRVIASTRRTLRLSQETLAYRCGVHPTTISQLERGVNSPTVRSLDLIAKQLNTRPSVLLAEAESLAEW